MLAGDLDGGEERKLSDGFTSESSPLALSRIDPKLSRCRQLPNSKLLLACAYEITHQIIICSHCLGLPFIV